MIDAAIGAIDSIPRARRKDLDLVQEAVRRAVRGAANEAWGKKPLVTVFVTRYEVADYGMPNARTPEPCRHRRAGSRRGERASIATRSAPRSARRRRCRSMA